MIRFISFTHEIRTPLFYFSPDFFNSSDSFFINFFPPAKTGNGSNYGTWLRWSSKRSIANNEKEEEDEDAEDEEDRDEEEEPAEDAKEGKKEEEEEEESLEGEEEEVKEEEGQRGGELDQKTFIIWTYLEIDWTWG